MAKFNIYDYNDYGFDSTVGDFNSLQNEARELAIHSHNHLTSAETRIVESIEKAEEEINENVDQAETTVVNKIETKGNDIKTDIKNNKSVIDLIWNKVNNWH